MKAFYTKEELLELSPEELEKIASFEGGDTTYYYEDIQKIIKGEEDEHCIIFKTGEEIYTQSDDVIQSIKANKIRYDLITKTLSEVQREQEIRNEFYNQIQDDIAKQMQGIHSQINVQKNNFELMTKAIQKQTNDDIAKLSNTVAETLENWNKRIDSLNSVDVDKFDKMMKQMETIASAFEVLLKD